MLAADTGLANISVILSPVDLGTRQIPPVDYPLPEWTDDLYQQIKQELSSLHQ